jgi:TonB family protein
MKLFLSLAAAVTLLVPGPAAADQARPAAAAERWRAWISVCSVGRRPADPAFAAPEGAAGIAGRSDCDASQLRNAILQEDLPAALLRRRFTGNSRIALDLRPDGAAAGCSVAATSGDARLDALACTLVSARANYRPLYGGPGRPIASRAEVDVAWETTNDPPPMLMAPPMLDGPQLASNLNLSPPRWPRLTWRGPIRFAAPPPIQQGYPAAAGRRSGTVGVDLAVSAERGIENCTVGQSSGDATLDEAACRVARTVTLLYASPCEVCGRQWVPLQIVWRASGGSHIRFPLPYLDRLEFGPAPPRDPADTRTAVAQRPFPVPIDFAVTAADYRKLRDRTVRNNRFVATVVVDGNGRPLGCRTRRSTGNAEVDARTCAIVMRRARYRPQTDAFGDPQGETDAASHVIELPPLG